MENTGIPSQPKRTESHRLGVSTHRSLADAAFLIQLIRTNRLPYLPFTLDELDAWAILFMAPGMPEKYGQHADSGDHQRFEVLTHLVSSLIAADAWSRAHQLPILTCPASERVRHLFETHGLADYLFVPIAEFLERLERAVLGGPGEGRSMTLRVFSGGPSSPFSDEEDPRAVPGRRTEAPEQSALSPGFAPERMPVRGDEPNPDEGEIASRLFSVEEPRRQLRISLQESRERAIDLANRLAWAESELRAVHQSRAWQLTTSMVRLRHRLIPENTRRNRLFGYLMAFVRTSAEQGLRKALAKASSKVVRRVIPARPDPECPPAAPVHGQGIVIPAVGPPAPLAHHRESIDVVVWIDRRYAEARASLETLVRRTRPPYRLILVHDGRDAATRWQLEQFAKGQDASVVSDPAATSLSSVIALAIPLTNAEYVAFLRCTTEVTRGWLDRLAACMPSDPRVGIAVPLSNRYLDEPSAEETGDSDDFGDAGEGPSDPHEIAARIAADSARLYSPLSHYDDDCMLVRRSALADGLRPAEASRPPSGSQAWIAVLADDVYVHMDSKMETSPCLPATVATETGHPAGAPQIEADRILEGIRGRTRHLRVRHAMRADGHRRWEGKRLLLILPVTAPGGGANVIFQEAAAMHPMGVDVQVLNLESNRAKFEASYPDLDLPSVFIPTPADLACVAQHYDAVIATLFLTVEWLRPLRDLDQPPRLGYYVQDYEPYLVMHDAGLFWQAWSSYTAFPELIRLTKTPWTRDEVKSRAGADCLMVGPSVNVDLFRPRPRLLPARPGVVRIAAMVRPTTTYRQGRLTMEVLRAVQRLHGDRVEILIFGCRMDELGDMPRDFPFYNAGILNPRQLAGLLNEVDVFVDFSSHQAMGLTAMEAMCCGAAVIVPTSGGAESFLRHEENGFMIDTSLPEDCIDALDTLVRDNSLRQSLGACALRDIGQFFPERAAYRILESLFPYPAEAR